MAHHHSVQGTTTEAGPSLRRPWLVLTVLAFAQFMLIVDITVVQVALPSIGTDLGLDRGALTWVVTTYTLVFGGLMVLGGRLADLLGAKRTLLVGLAIFTLASLVCGLAGSAAALIIGRAAQGLGAALLSPAALSILTTTFHGQARNRALGVWAAIGGTGAAVGVLVSGLLTAGPGWRWVFFINVPIGVAGLVVIPLLIRRDIARAREGLDVLGAVLVTTATALLIYGLVEAGDVGWSASSVVVPVVAAVVAYGAFALVQARSATPLMRPSTIARRPVISGTFLMLVATGLLLGMFFLTSIYLQHMLGFTALETGLLFLPTALAITAGAQLAARLISHVGGRAVAITSFVLTAAGAYWLAQVSPGDNAYTAILPGFLLASFGIGPAFVTATTTTLANVPAEESGVASGVVNTFHELGGSIGVAVVSTVAAASITASAAQPDVSGFTNGYLTWAIVALVAAVVAAGLVPPGKPEGMTGHGHGHGH